MTMKFTLIQKYNINIVKRHVDRNVNWFGIYFKGTIYIGTENQFSVADGTIANNLTDIVKKSQYEAVSHWIGIT